MKIGLFILLFNFIPRGSGIEPRIVGGQIVDIANYPYMVSVQRISHKYLYHTCGGSIIRSDVVLTAAHCLTELSGIIYKKFRPKELKVFAGMTHLTNQSKHQGRAIKTVIVHSWYIPLMFLNDIGILRLKKPFDLDRTVQLVRLAPQDMFAKKPPWKYFKNDSCTIAGWGVLYYGSKFATDELRAVTLPIINNDRCEILLQRIGLLSTLVESQMCTMKTGKDACQGDSGGPLVCNGTQIGIVSYGKDCGKKNMPNVWTRVDKMGMWINKHMKSSSSRLYNRVISIWLWLHLTRN